MSIFREFNINMIPGKLPLIINVSQYESDFVYTFHLRADKGALAIPDTAIAFIRGTKRDGNGYSAEVALDAEKHKVVVMGDPQLTACAGRNVFELAIINDGKTICTSNFFLEVERAPLDSDTITSETVLHDLQAIIDSAATATQAAEEASASAESAASAAEQAVEEKFEEGVAETIDEWLTNHPEATTTVQDGSLTYKKLVNGTLGFVMPEMYGAVGDGVTDDTQAIRDAITQGNIVLFLHNDYLVSGTLLIPSNRILYGKGCTIHASHDGKVFANEHFAGNTIDENIVICGFVIDNALNEVRATGKANMIYLCGVNNVEISNCKIINSASDGIYLGSYNFEKSTDNVHIHDCYIDDFTRQGISVVCGSGVIVERCFIGDGANDPYSFCIDLEPNNTYEKVSVEIKDCIFTYGVNVYLNNSNADNYLKIENVDISDNYSGARTSVSVNGNNTLLVDVLNSRINGAGSKAITLYQCALACVRNNIIQANSEACLYLSNIARGVIDNNTITELATSSYFAINVIDSVISMQNNNVKSNYNGITIRGTSVVQVINNYIDASYSGVATENTSVDEIISNDIVNCTHYGIYLGSSENIISNNRIYGDSNSPTVRAITFNNSINNIITGNIMKNCTDGIKPAPTTGVVDNNVIL